MTPRNRMIALSAATGVAVAVVIGFIWPSSAPARVTHPRPSPSASASPSTSPTPHAAVWRWHCGKDATVFVSGGRYGLRNDVWAANGCVGNKSLGPNFTVAHNTDNTWGVESQSFQNLFIGCEWWQCSKSSLLPAPMSQLTCLRASADFQVPVSGKWAAAYDIFLSPKAQYGGLPDGVEVMVWLNASGFSNQYLWPVVDSAGYSWYFEHWLTGLNGHDWPLVILRLQHPATGEVSLPLLTLLRTVEAHGLLRSGWHVNSVEAGIEDWSGGNGFRISNLNIRACV